MKRIAIFIGVLFIFLSIFSSKNIFASDKISNFSLDFNYTLVGLRNNGWGLGLGYEYLIYPHFAILGVFGHSTFLTDLNDFYCTTVNLSLGFNYYIQNRGLEGIYVGLSNGTDFLMYFGSTTSELTQKKGIL